MFFVCPERHVRAISRKRTQTVILCALALFVQTLTLSHAIQAQGLTGSIKGTVSATAGDPSARKELVPGARLTLVNRDLPSAAFKTVTDDTGAFVFLDLPAATYTLTAEANGLPSATSEIRLTTGAALVVDVVLTASVTESVTVRDQEGLLSTGEVTTSNTVRVEKLEQLPLRADNYQGALPLTPGVIRGLDGGDHIKGTRAGQNSYTVNGADITDPVNGNLAFDIPLEAAASVHIEDNPYSAEFGKTTGGASNLETKSGGDKFKFGSARIFPVGSASASRSPARCSATRRWSFSTRRMPISTVPATWPFRRRSTVCAHVARRSCSCRIACRLSSRPTPCCSSIGVNKRHLVHVRR